MATIPIRDVPGEAVKPSGNELILIDNGITMQKATINDAVTPKASEIADQKIADLNLGTASQANVEDFATAEQGQKADSALQPTDIGTSVQAHGDFLDDLAAMDPGSAGQVIAFDPDGKPIPVDAWSGDMLKSVYDPDENSSNAFDLSNQYGNKPTDFPTVADLLADTSLGYSAARKADQVAEGDIIEAQGSRYEVAASDAEDAHVETAGGVRLYIMPDASGCLPFEAWGGRRAEDDPLFDNSDVFDLIHAYVHSDKGTGVERAIKFPIGRFNHSRTLKIDWGHATFIGSGSLAGAAGPTPEQPIRSDGTFICYTGNDGGIGVDVGSGSSNYIYHVTIENIRFGAAGASTANCTVMRWKGLSEFYFRNVALQAGNVLLELDSVGIGNLSSFYMSASSEAHMLFNGETGQIGSIWFENANLWHAKNSTFKFIAGNAQRVSFTDSWVELAEHIFEFAPDVDATANFSSFQFVRTRFQTGSDFEDNWPTPGREGWFIKAVASQDYTNRSLFIDGWVFDDCDINISNDPSPGAAVVYERGDNIGAQSLIQNMTFRGGYFTGAAYTIFRGPGSIFCYGTRKDSSIQWTDGSTTVARLGQEFHYWEFDGRPVRLPVIQNPSSTIAGQIYWHQSTQFPRVVDRDGVARTVLHNIPVTTAGRPALSGGAGLGVMVFDTDLGKPIWWDGSAWVDATGTSV